MVERQFIKTSRLNKREIKNLRNLLQDSYKNDRFYIRLYWNIINQRELDALDDYLYYINGKLVGYFAIFVFKDTEAEISAVVHPDFRKQGLFTLMMQDAALDLDRRDISLCQLICHEKSEGSLKIVEKYGGKYDHSELEMELKQKVKLADLPEVELRLAGEEDIQILAQIDADAFDTDVDHMVFRFTQNLAEKNRMAFVASHNGMDVGKTHIRFDHEGIAFIHDLGVPPKLRRKGYAAAMVMELINVMKKKGYGKIALDVLDDNTNAIKLYQKCGFEITDEHKFYNVPTKRFLDR